jgi:hypothetical protein
MVRAPGLPLVVTAFLLLVLASPGCAQSTTPSSTVVTVAVTGDDVLPANLTVWDQFPVMLSDQIEYSIAAMLNSLASGTTTPPPPAADNNEGLSWYAILGIVGGGVVLIAAIALLAMNGVMMNKANKPQPQPQPQPPPGEYALVPPNDGSSAGYKVYPPPRPTSKVIQVVLAPPIGGGRASV